jgi:mono/diheme cytochrome c family protein
MRSGVLIPLFALVVACTVSAVAADNPSRNIAANDLQSGEQIDRGRYLARLADCNGCHTVPGEKPYAGGLPLATPFGTILVPNLTPDRETGIGAWSDADFIAALQQGKGPGYHLYPAMPYTYYTKMSRDDILAIRAYLNTLEPVRHEVVANQLPFPFNIRASMAIWNALFFTPGEFQPRGDKSPEWNRGAYLVQGPGHCGMCHTPKNFLGADRTSRALQGGVLVGWFAPNLTSDPYVGVGSWSVDEIVRYLKAGHNLISFASGPMAEVITDSTNHLTDDDLKAIATYLKDIPAPAATAPTPVAANTPPMRAGEAIYVDNCAACHTMQGNGVPHIFPSLKNSPTVRSVDPTSLIRVVLRGTQNVATDQAPTAPSMPSFDWKLSDAQVAAVVTYIRNSWGNAAASVSAGDVSKIRAQAVAEAP